MEPYESDTEGDEQETPLLPGGHEVKFQKGHKGSFFLFHVAFKNSNCGELKRNLSMLQLICSLEKSLSVLMVRTRTSKVADVHAGTELILLVKSL